MFVFQTNSHLSSRKQPQPHCKNYYDEEDNWSMASSYPIAGFVFALSLLFFPTPTGLLCFCFIFPHCSSKTAMLLPLN